VIYLELSGPEDGDQAVIVRRLRLDQRGEFIGPWPGGFFDEREEELFS